MTSLFKRYLWSYGLMVVVIFSLLGGAFLHQINMLAVEEKKLTIEDTVEKTIESTLSYQETRRTISNFLARQSLENTYRMNLMQLASYSGGTIYITDADGVLRHTAKTGSCLPGNGYKKFPDLAVQAVLKNNIYSDVSSLAGYLDEPAYIQGMPVFNEMGNLVNLVFVSLPAESSMRFFQNMNRTFWGFLLVAIVATLVTTYIIVLQTARPIQNMSATAKRFERGDFSSRVQLPTIQDELYSLMVNFNTMADSIEKSEMEQRGLIANVSHDLRTPMTTISGFVDGILDGTIKPENQQKYLQIVSDEVKRLSRLANDMVEVSRMQSDAEVLNFSQFDITEIVCRVAISFETKINDKNITVDLNMPDFLALCADRDSIFRVVYNLIDNAVKFTNQDGTIAISITTAGGMVSCSIKNTGTPIPQEETRSVFERFYKLDKSRSENKHGAGLGLYIAKNIINKHGGDISATSLADGTEFTFSIPKGKKNDI